MSVRLLFVKGKQRNFLKNFLEINNLTLNPATELLNIGRTTFKEWLKERYTLPHEIFSKICEMTPQLNIYENEIKERLSSNWGQVKGGRKRILDGHEINESLENARKMKNLKRLDSSFFSKKEIRIKNKLLGRLVEEKVNLKCILATCLLTDGSLSNEGEGYRISYYAKDIVLKNFIKALLFKLSKFIPSENFDKRGIYAIRVNDKYLVNELHELSPTFKKMPRKNQTKKEYLTEIQPSLKFLKNTNDSTIKWCIRFAFSTDGCISISKNNTKELNLACYHPVLAREWAEIIEKYGMKVHLGKDKTSWCGIDGVRIYDLTSIKNFIKIGGFVPGVKISNKSKRFNNLEKNMLLKSIVNGRVA